MYYCLMDSPVGKLLLLSDGEYLTGLYLNRNPGLDWMLREELPVFHLARHWLKGYFSGSPGDPEAIPIRLEGTAFQKRVWEILLTIPWGELRTYGDIAGQLAREMGKGKMSGQAVGQAVGRNPVSILVPCHRVMGAGNRLTGYGGGLENKEWLLRHEGWKGE